MKGRRGARQLLLLAVLVQRRRVRWCPPAQPQAWCGLVSYLLPVRRLDGTLWWNLGSLGIAPWAAVSLIQSTTDARADDSSGPTWRATQGTRYTNLTICRRWRNAQTLRAGARRWACPRGSPSMITTVTDVPNLAVNSCLGPTVRTLGPRKPGCHACARLGMAPAGGEVALTPVPAVKCTYLGKYLAGQAVQRLHRVIRAVI